MLKVTVQEKEDELECSCEAEGNLNDICNQTLNAIQCIYDTLRQTCSPSELLFFREMVKAGVQWKDSPVWRKPEKEEK